jgi:hypothetical protein
VRRILDRCGASGNADTNRRRSEPCLSQPKSLVVCFYLIVNYPVRDSEIPRQVAGGAQ